VVIKKKKERNGRRKPANHQDLQSRREKGVHETLKGKKKKMGKKTQGNYKGGSKRKPGPPEGFGGGRTKKGKKKTKKASRQRKRKTGGLPSVEKGEIAGRVCVKTTEQELCNTGGVFKSAKRVLNGQIKNARGGPFTVDFVVFKGLGKKGFRNPSSSPDQTDQKMPEQGERGGLAADNAKKRFG